MNNLAAALLKVGEWDQADVAATWALHRDPKLVKARYRRGLARKEMGNFVFALNGPTWTFAYWYRELMMFQISRRS